MARPKTKINMEELEKLYALQCTDREVAAYLGISLRTLERRKDCKQFAEVVGRAKLKGAVSVRRHLFRLAAAGNIAAVIFLAKNVLGYRDVVSNEHSGPNGAPIQLETKPDLSQLTDDELQQLKSIASKTGPPHGHRR